MKLFSDQNESLSSTSLSSISAAQSNSLLSLENGTKSQLSTAAPSDSDMLQRVESIEEEKDNSNASISPNLEYHSSQSQNTKSISKTNKSKKSSPGKHQQQKKEKSTFFFSSSSSGTTSSDEVDSASANATPPNEFNNTSNAYTNQLDQSNKNKFSNEHPPIFIQNTSDNTQKLMSETTSPANSNDTNTYLSSSNLTPPNTYNNPPMNTPAMNSCFYSHMEERDLDAAKSSTNAKSLSKFERNNLEKRSLSDILGRTFGLVSGSCFCLFFFKFD